jgi:hypothetical protein
MGLENLALLPSFPVTSQGSHLETPANQRFCLMLKLLGHLLEIYPCMNSSPKDLRVLSFFFFFKRLKNSPQEIVISHRGLSATV